MKINRGEIWLADLNPRFGTEAGKTRPVLVVQTDLLNSRHPSTLVCPLTTQVRKRVNILRVNLAKGTANLRKSSAVMIDQLRAIDNKRLIQKIGELPDDELKKVNRNLDIILDL